MEFLLLLALYILGYSVVGVFTSIVLTRAYYEEALEKPHVPAIRAKSWTPLFTDEQLEERETQRRADLAKEASKNGVVSGILWPLALIMVIIVGPFIIGKSLVKKFSIDPVDDERHRQLAYVKAKRIVTQYELEKKNQFEKELGHG